MHEAKRLIKKFEGLRLKPYLCPAGYPTIGYGMRFYENGTKVKLSDEQITVERAEQLLDDYLLKLALKLKPVFISELNSYQLAAILSFVFNVGIANFKKSTLLKKININPNDPDIYAEFLKWNKATVAGEKVVLSGLTKRRKEEGILYFKRN